MGLFLGLLSLGGAPQGGIRNTGAKGGRKGAGNGVRTRGPLLGKEVLYH